MRASYRCPRLQDTTDVQHRAQCSETNDIPAQAPFVSPTLLDLCCAVLLLSMLMESHVLLPHLHPAFTFITCPALIRSWSGDVSICLSNAVMPVLAGPQAPWLLTRHSSSCNNQPGACCLPLQRLKLPVTAIAL